MLIIVLWLTLIRAQKPAQAEDYLSRCGFVIMESSAPHFTSIYKDFQRSKTPIYITSDPLLHGIHLIYDYSLRFVEENYFYDNLTEILLYLRDKFIDLSQVKNRELSSAARTNLAYVEVVLKLLNPNFIPSEIVANQVLEEIALIESHEGFDTSRVLNVIEDFSQYKVRGHYTRSEKLKNYFKAMMYLGRMHFYLNPEGSEKNLNIQLTRSAILMAHLIAQDSTIFLKYKNLYEITSYLVGESDDINFLDLIPLTSKYFPSVLTDIIDEQKILAFMREASLLKKPRIFSTYFEDVENPEKKLVCAKFMGQKYIPDSYIFQNLVYSKVGTRAKPRLFPKSLDLLAVLGNERAKEVLFKFYKEDRYLNYSKMLDSLTREFSRFEMRKWRQNAYLNWLYIIKTMNKSPEFPESMRVSPECYQDKLLITQRGFWAELRHDTILYAKQSYTAKVTAFIPQDGPYEVFVEPLPETYNEMINFLKNFKDTLQHYGILNNEIADKINMEVIYLQDMLTAVQLQKAGKSLPYNLRKKLYSFGDFLESLYSFSQGFAQTAQDTLLPLVADVHTDVNTKSVLEVAVGKPLEIWIMYNNILYKGAMFSYYEFTHPMDKRLTDEEWQKMVPYPPLEEWLRLPLMKMSKE